MIHIEKLREFQKMWTWLSEHPAHDREYYMHHVVKLETPWPNDCPLSSESSQTCDSCHMLWGTKKGNLCTDPESPLNLWKVTSVDYPDTRTHYAGKVASIALNHVRNLQAEPK